MNKHIDPAEFGLPAKTIIELVDQKTLALVINRKSRIIMADGRKIAEKIGHIKKEKAGMQVVLKVPFAPICSKTANYFEANGIQVIKE